MIDFEFWSTLVSAIVMAAWLAFGILFFARKKSPAAPESKRERTAILGIALQGAGYGIAWSVHRPFFSPIVALSKSLEIGLAASPLLLAVGSGWFVAAAFRTLAIHRVPRAPLPLRPHLLTTLPTPLLPTP